MVCANQILIHAKESKEKEVKELLNELVALSLLANGCQKYELYQLNEKREEFFIIEIFKSEKKYSAYLENPEYKELRVKIDILCEFHRLNPLKLPQCLTKLGLKKNN